MPSRSQTAFSLKLSDDGQAEVIRVHRNTLNKVDMGEGKASTIQLLRFTLEARGVQFPQHGETALGNGVAMKSDESD
jgi:hypothetical protein